MKVIIEGQIKEEFYGFEESALFELTNSTYWLQIGDRKWKHHEYKPKAYILVDNNWFFIEVAGAIVDVKQIFNVNKSRIDGEFRGWNGDSAYHLINGQKWRQARYRYEKKYANCPDAIIYEGTEGYFMSVQGTYVEVERE